MNNRKLVFFDIDGTLWDYQGIIPDSAYEAVKQLKSNGHIPIICSGRARGHIRDEKLMSLGFEGIIAACGNHVEIDNKILYERYVDNSIVKEIVRLSIECNVPIVLEGPKKHWISPTGFELDDFVTRMYNVMKEDAINFTEYTPDMIINKFSGDVTVNSDYKTFKAGLVKYFNFIEHGLIQEFDQRPDKDFNIITDVFEGILPGTSKADGIRLICNHFGVDPKDAYAIGDSNNDIEMIECVGTGIAMLKGSERLRQVADYVTTDIWDDGIKNALKYYNLINM